MRRFTKTAVVAAASAVALLGATSPAEAATLQPMSYHSGSTGCFNYSWSDGMFSTTLYYHNTCGHKALLEVTWGSAFSNFRCVAPYVHDHYTEGGGNGFSSIVPHPHDETGTRAYPAPKC